MKIVVAKMPIRRKPITSDNSWRVSMYIITTYKVSLKRYLKLYRAVYIAVLYYKLSGCVQLQRVPQKEVLCKYH